MEVTDRTLKQRGAAVTKRKSQFSYSQRWAIWTGYGMKCFKCHKPVEFDHCQIARVVPESVSKIVLSSLVRDYGLAADFSVDDLANLAPVCRACNKGKANTVFRSSAIMQSWFEQIRVKVPQVEAKIRLIDGDHTAESLLKLLVEKVERGDIKPEDVERVLKPFLDRVEGKPRNTVELRLSDSVRLSFSEAGLRMQPVTEIRYQKFVEGMVESGDWRRKSPEVIREGPTFGEGRSRKVRGGP
jgi:hypothetical protein